MHGHSLCWGWTSTMAHQTATRRILLFGPNGKIGPHHHHDGLYPAQMAQTSIVVLRRCLPLRRSRDPQLIKGRWSVDRGIDYFKGDADVNVSVVAQNFLMVKMAGRSFGREKTMVWLYVTMSFKPGGRCVRGANQVSIKIVSLSFSWKFPTFCEGTFHY